jgi:hypothetical protein
MMTDVGVRVVTGGDSRLDGEEIGVTTPIERLFGNLRAGHDFAQLRGGRFHPRLHFGSIRAHRDFTRLRGYLERHIQTYRGIGVDL